MGLLNCSLENKSAEYVGRLILDNSRNVELILKQLKKNPNWLEDNIDGEITSSTLLKLLRMKWESQNNDELLTYIIDIIPGTAIDDLVFEEIFSYPDDNVRTRMLVSLAHKKLNENQLQCLCAEGISFECYFELAILYYMKSKYSLETLKQFIEESFIQCNYSYMLEELIDELVESHTASDEVKREYIKGIRFGLQWKKKTLEP